MWKHVWKGVWWKHFYASNACSLSLNSLFIFSLPLQHLSPGVNICVFLCLYKFFGDIIFFSFHSSPHWNTLLSEQVLFLILFIYFFFLKGGHSLLCARRKRRKKLALITSRQKTPLTNSKQGARSLLWLRARTHIYRKCYSSPDDEIFDTAGK